MIQGHSSRTAGSPESQRSRSETWNWFLTLDNDEYVDLALTESGMKTASVTAKGRLALGLYRPFPTPSAPDE